MQSDAFQHVSTFVNEVASIQNSGLAKEHSYRAAIAKLLQQLSDSISTIVEPKRIECGAPDVFVLRNNKVVGHLEGKDFGEDIENPKGRDLQQLNSYRDALPNLILTNCLDWHYYRDGQRIRTVSIGKSDGTIKFNPEKFAELDSILADFVSQELQTITEPNELASKMAGKARLLKDVFYLTLQSDKSGENELTGQYKAFQRNLIADISIEDFSETYAETITYGMFAAMLRETNPASFNRMSALFLIPKSNPFLRNLFGFIAGPNLDDRLAWIIDDLADIFMASDMEAIMQGFGKLTGHNDPFIHFYETFLSAFNPDKRKMRGVWYTPEPIVKFIVRAVDQVLKSEFDLPTGLADSSKVTIDFDTGQRQQTKKGQLTKDGKQQKVRKEVHRVQILDPCTGTGTFLTEVVKNIAPKINRSAPALWSNYVEEDLIPRLHGFEIMMSSYAMCHIKLDMMLDELGYKPENSKRLSVYLTNSLEEGSQADQTFSFDQWLVREAKEANTIKRDMPIMCVIGNPPYLGESGATKGWIGDLLDDYKKEPGGHVKLQERNYKWLNDIYIKFIRLASHLIDKNGEGVMGLITNHGYLDSNTFRGMRWHLLQTFDKIWILDLHGNVMRKEVSATAEPDQNVFDIRQGVAIIVAVKSRDSGSKLAELMHGEIYGDRQSKYEALEHKNIDDRMFKKIETNAPYFPFINWNYELFNEYQKGFLLNEFMPVNSVGIVTARDQFTIDEDREALWNRLQKFVQINPEDARVEFGLGKDVRDWRVAWAQEDVKRNQQLENVVPIAYRPFDIRWTFYTGNSRGFLCFPRHTVMNNFLAGENAGLVYSRQVANDEGPPVNAFITNTIFDGRGVYTNKGISQVAPLYVFPPDGDLIEDRIINFKPDQYEKLCQLAQSSGKRNPSEWDVFDYVYGMLFCQSYHEKYDQFLRMDFPRIPWPKNSEKFWDVSDTGKRLRQLHLSISDTKGSDKYNLVGQGSNVVELREFKDNQIWINKSQYFDNIPADVWNLYIGGYQPAQQWLKDRKGKELTYAKLKHYQSILEILRQTIAIMNSVEI